MTVPSVPGAVPHLRVRNRVRVHATPLTTRRQAARALTTELEDKDVSFPALVADNVGADFARKPLVRARYLFLREDSLPKYLITQAQPSYSGNRVIMRRDATVCESRLTQ